MPDSIADGRTEQDLLGSLVLPKDCPWGIHTERARHNFACNGGGVPPRMIQAYARVKQACCRANAAIGALPADTAAAIDHACELLAAGAHADAFPLDALQGGAGTSTNMNLNEVIANLALDQLGISRGRYDRVHPLDHVNLHQSTNDTYPTALRVAAIDALRHAAAPAAQALQGALQGRELAFARIVTVGRTETQPALPMTLGQIFGAMAEAVSRDRWRLFKCEERLRVVNLGGTAVGTGIGAPRSYIFHVIEALREATGFGLCRGDNLPGETAFADALVEVSGILKAAACNLVKLGRDLRRLQAEGDIALPDRQAGSSFMPGKVNPVVCEAVIQAGLWVQAQDALVGQCAGLGSGQINEFMPLLCLSLLGAMERQAAATGMLAGHVEGISAREEACAAKVAACPGLAVALMPDIGYDQATELVRRGQAEGVTDWRAYLGQAVGPARLDDRLRPERLLQLGFQKDAEHP